GSGQPVPMSGRNLSAARLPLALLRGPAGTGPPPACLRPDAPLLGQSPPPGVSVEEWVIRLAAAARCFENGSATFQRARPEVQALDDAWLVVFRDAEAANCAQGGGFPGRC